MSSPHLEYIETQKLSYEQLRITTTKGHSPLLSKPIIMLQGLPDDILLELVEVHLFDASNPQSRDALCNFSLTSRRFRSFAIRVLYRSLSFRTDLRRTVTLQDKMGSMIRNHTRAKHLIQSRHLLRNVQRLSLHYWDGNLPNSPGFGELGDVADADGLHLVAEDVKKMMEVIYDNLTRLVPHMPSLKELRLFKCVMTPFLYAAISACPLNLLHVRTDSPADPIHISTDLPQQLHITNLHFIYTRPTWKLSDDGKFTDPFFTRILEHCISSLEELSFVSSLLPTFASYISDKTLSLKYLSVTFPARHKARRPANTWQISVARSLWDILLASPQLRTLIINGTFSTNLLPQDLSQLVLPNLVEVSARSYVLPTLTQGRNIQRVHMSQWFGVYEEPIITQLIRCSPTHLRQLATTWATPQTVHVFLDFIQSLSVFNNLESLDITYDIDSTLWVEYDDIEGISNTITNLLQGLACLHTCHIWTVNDSDSPSSPPLLVDPQSLDHPSLKVLGIDFFTKDVWYRDMEVGWVQGEWEPTQAQIWYNRN